MATDMVGCSVVKKWHSWCPRKKNENDALKCHFGSILKHWLLLLFCLDHQKCHFLPENVHTGRALNHVRCLKNSNSVYFFFHILLFIRMHMHSRIDTHLREKERHASNMYYTNDQGPFLSYPISSTHRATCGASVRLRVGLDIDSYSVMLVLLQVDHKVVSPTWDAVVQGLRIDTM